MARNPAAQTAVGPMLIVALEQAEPPGRRLVDDDLPARFLPAPARWLVGAPLRNPMRRLAMTAMEREGPGLWASMTCRKSYIADKASESLDDVDAVVVLGAEFDTLAYRLARKASVRSSRSTNPSTSLAKPRRCDGRWARSRARFTWCRSTLSVTTFSRR